ncbi:transposase [Vibrio cholerae]|nr:transposase [Vibrio cholerae]GIA62407.1 transposase [Vibrio cholerae]
MTYKMLKPLSKFGCMDASLMARLKELEAENARLKKCTPKST